MPVYFAPIFVSVLLALLYQWRVLRAERALVGAVALSAALIAGLRFEIGQDWPAYSLFFREIDIGVGPIDSFVHNGAYYSFEFGYHELNYFIKLFGGNYHVVLLVASIFCSYAVYKLATRIHANAYYVLAMYFSYGFLVLQFAQVRQSIAIGLIVLSCVHYATNRNRLLALSIAMLAPFFQFSALMYVALLTFALYWRDDWSIKTGVMLLLLLSTPLLVFREQINFYTVLAEITFSESAQSKLAQYEQSQVDQSSGVLFVALYLLALATYLLKYEESVELRLRFLVRLAIAATLLTVLFVVVFPNSYVMFSRAFVFASILQAVGVALIVERRRGAHHVLVLLGSLAFGVVYCLRLLTLMADEYFPYRTILY